MTKAETLEDRETARLWSIACAVGRHTDCGALFDSGTLVVVCPCDHHDRCPDCGVDAGVEHLEPCVHVDGVGRG